MKLVALAGMLLLLASNAGAETYSWTDENGTYNFTDDVSSVPKKYRKNVEKRGDLTGQPEAQRQAEPNANVKAAPVAAVPGDAAGGQKQETAGSGLYDGKKPEVWQQDFRTREAEYKQLEQQLVQIERLIKNPGGISKSRYDALPGEFKETQKQYLEKLKNYNELNDDANKAGLPVEFRK
jgi:Domain of unknown function (DUF4124)